MRRYFEQTVGQHLELVGIRAARNEYNEGLEKAPLPPR